MKKNTMYKYTEREMVLSFCELLKRRNVSFAVEVPFFHRSIDLVYVDEKGSVHALEFKINDWKKAIKQAQDCSLGAHYVYVCLPLEKFNDNIKDEIANKNIGLILFDVKSETVTEVKAGENNKYWEGAVTTLRQGFDYSLKNNNYLQLQQA